MRFGVLLGGLLVLGCAGNGAINLTIDGQGPTGTLRVPDDVDKVLVKITNADQSSTLLEKEYPLASDVTCTSATAACGQTPENARFPLTLGIDAGGKTPSEVRIYVNAMKTEAPVADTNALVPISASEVTNVTLRIVKSP